MISAAFFFWSKDPAKTAYLVAGGSLKSIDANLEQSLGVAPRGKWHVSLWWRRFGYCDICFAALYAMQLCNIMIVCAVRVL